MAYQAIPPVTVYLTSLESISQATVLGRADGAGTGSPTALTQTQLTALINPATSALTGAMPITSRLFQPARGTNLGDATVTIQPFTDGAAVYVLPAGTLTANRTITFGNTSAPGAGVVWLCTIIRLDLSAFTIQYKRADTTNIYLDPATPAVARYHQFICNNGTWAANTGQLLG